MIFVYILRSKQGKFYTGITKSIDRRFQEHINGRCKSTRDYEDVIIVFSTHRKDYQDARRLEVYIKQISAKDFLNRIYNDVPLFFSK